MPGGSLLLFDRKVLRYFRKDGHNWRKKKDGKTVKEAHEKLKVRLQKRSIAFIWSLGIYIWSCRTHIFSHHKKKKNSHILLYDIDMATWIFNNFGLHMLSTPSIFSESHSVLFVCAKINICCSIINAQTTFFHILSLTIKINVSIMSVNLSISKHLVRVMVEKYYQECKLSLHLLVMFVSVFLV